jgi:2-hydroxycyclohexanecarboxyl-CoA dehydrogenase
MQNTYAQDQVVVVTGAASGIGLGIAQHLARQGHRVALLDRQGDAVRQAADFLAAEGATVLAAEVDVTDRGAVDKALNTVRAAFGPIEIMITSAGIDESAAICDITIDAWDRAIAVNLTGTFHCLQAVVPDMTAAGWGRIITISSSSAQSGAPDRAHYIASKGGVIGLTKAFAYELAPKGITVNTIPPSIIDTPMARAGEGTGEIPGIEILASMTPVRRVGTPDDVAAACAFLCSEQAGFITGQLIGVNGGWYI